MNAALYEAFETADVDRMERVWDDVAPDAVVCVHPGWPMLRGREQVLRSWSAVMAGTDYIQFFLTDVRVHVRGDVAVVTCTENVLTEVTRGGPRRRHRRRDQRAGAPARRLARAGAPRLAGAGASSPMSDRITLTGLRVRGFHGVLPRGAPRRPGLRRRRRAPPRPAAGRRDRRPDADRPLRRARRARSPRSSPASRSTCSRRSPRGWPTSAWPPGRSSASRSRSTSRRRRSPLDVRRRQRHGGAAVTAVLSIGSNLGDRLAHLRRAVEVLGPVACSRRLGDRAGRRSGAGRLPQRGAALRRSTRPPPGSGRRRPSRPPGACAPSAGGRAPSTSTSSSRPPPVPAGLVRAAPPRARARVRPGAVARGRPAGAAARRRRGARPAGRARRRRRRPARADLAPVTPDPARSAARPGRRASPCCSTCWPRRRTARCRRCRVRPGDAGAARRDRARDGQGRRRPAGAPPRPARTPARTAAAPDAGRPRSRAGQGQQHHRRGPARRPTAACSPGRCRGAPSWPPPSATPLVAGVGAGGAAARGRGAAARAGVPHARRARPRAAAGHLESAA